MPSTAVTIATICSGALRIECARALVLAATYGLNVDLVAAPPYLDSARNQRIVDFLETTDEWLVFIDSDISFTPDDIEALTSTDQRVVAGVYGSPFAEGFRTVTYLRDADSGRHRALTHTELYALPRHDGLVRVDSVGAGCLAIHRSVLEEMRERFPSPTPWFVEPPDGDVVLGEDHGFCARIASMGLGPWVHPKVLVPHFKTLAVTVPKETFHAAV